MSAQSAFDRLTFPRRTERLTLRRIEPTDRDAWVALRGAPGVGRWLSASRYDVESLTADFAEPSVAAANVVIELDGVLIGDLHLDVRDAWAQRPTAAPAKGVEAVIGWTLLPSCGGKGYATEAAEELLRMCFEELGIHRALAICFVENEPSWRLMERLGMRRACLCDQGRLARGIRVVRHVLLRNVGRGMAPAAQEAEQPLSRRSAPRPSGRRVSGAGRTDRVP